MPTLATIMTVLETLPKVALAAPAFRQLFHEIKQAFSDDDQDALQEAYDRVMAENDEGHARLQDKLRG